MTSTVYDIQGRAIAMVDPLGDRTSFAYDGAGRMTYVYDAANQLQTEKLGGAITTYSYDPNGNRASQITGAAITSFTWDEENRLTAIAYLDATLTTYLYSADGVRQRKIDSTGTVNYLWDESRLLQETDVSLVEIVRYTQGIEGWQTMSSQRRGGVDSFFAYDQIGNTRQIVDITGAVTDTTTYEVFGVERTRTGTTLTNVQFGGQYNYIRDLFGLSRAGLRIVDSKTGQWLSRDPIGFWGGDWNLVRYVGNDPVNGVDPTGLVAPLVLAGCGIACGCVAGMVAECLVDAHGRAVGHRAEAFQNCMKDTWDGLPTWAKVATGACYAGCVTCVVLAIASVVGSGGNKGAPKCPPCVPPVGTILYRPSTQNLNAHFRTIMWQFPDCECREIPFEKGYWNNCDI